MPYDWAAYRKSHPQVAPRVEALAAARRSAGQSSGITTPAKVEAAKAVGKVVAESRTTGQVTITTPKTGAVKTYTAAVPWKRELVAAPPPWYAPPERRPTPTPAREPSIVPSEPEPILSRLPIRPEIQERFEAPSFQPRAEPEPVRPAIMRAEKIYEEAGPAGQFGFAMQTLLTGRGRELIGAVPGEVLPRLPTPPTPKEIPSLVKPEYPFGLGERLYVPRKPGFVPTRTPKDIIVESLAEIIGTPYKPVRVKEAPRVKGVLPSGIEAMLGPSPPAIEFAGTAFEAGVAEFFVSPVFEIELAALAGVGFTKLAGIDIAGKLITKGIAKTVVTVPGAKYIPYGIGAGITALKFAEAEQLKAAGRPEAALGGLLTFGAAVGIAGIGARAERVFLTKKELAKYTTQLELGEVTYGAKVGKVKAEAVIFREGKPLSKAELRTAFQITEPGKPFAIITAAKVTKLPIKGVGVEKFIGLGKGRVLGKGFLKITDRGISIGRKGVMGTAETYLFGPGLKLKAGAEAYGITITEKGLYKSVTEVTGWTKEGIPFKQLGVSLITKKAPIIDYYPKEVRPVTTTKPFAPPAVTASLEATTKQIASVIGTAAVPKTPAGVGVLAGGISSLISRAERVEEKVAYPARVKTAFPKTELDISPWARRKKLDIEEEVYISPRAREVVGVQALDTRQRVITMQRLGLGTGQAQRTLSDLGITRAVTPRERMALVSGVSIMPRLAAKVKPAVKLKPALISRAAMRQRISMPGVAVPAISIPVGIPLALLPSERKRVVKKKRRVRAPKYKYRKIKHPFPSLKELMGV